MKKLRTLSTILGFIGLGIATWYQATKENAEAEAQMKKTRNEVKELFLMGQFYEEDEYDEGITARGWFSSDNMFSITYTASDIDFRVTYKGTWRLEDGYLYTIYDEIEPRLESLLEDLGAEEKVKIISYDNSKIIYEDEDGKRRTRHKVTSGLAK